MEIPLVHSTRDLLWVACGIGLFQARAIFRLVRERNYSRELLMREQAHNTERLRLELSANITQQNELVRILATAFSSGEPLTLGDLLSRAERDFTVPSSER